MFQIKMVLLSVSGQNGDKSDRQQTKRRQVVTATTAVKTATIPLVKTAKMLENGNNKSLCLKLGS